MPLLLLLAASVASAIDIEFDADQLSRLQSSQTAWGHTSTDTGVDVGWAARVIDAPPDDIWALVTDYDAYADFMPHVVASSLDRSEHTAELDTWICSMSLEVKGIVTHYEVENRRVPGQPVMTFELLSNSGPLRGGDGSWRIEPWGDSGQTLVAYSVELDTAWWVPGFIKRKAEQRLPTVVNRLDRELKARHPAP